MKKPAFKIFYSIFMLFLLSANFCTAKNPDIIIDSKMTFKEAIKGTKAPQEIIDQLTLLDVQYLSKDGKIHQGQLVINKAVKDDVEAMFKFMLDEKFVIEKVIPIVKYGWSDDRSMEDNNTSSFNYRKIAGSDKISNHALGRAVDINTRWNPAVHPDRVSPKNGKYNPKARGTLTAGCAVTKKFKSLGWVWGGDWHSFQDYQHFDKRK